MSDFIKLTTDYLLNLFKFKIHAKVPNFKIKVVYVKLE